MRTMRQKIVQVETHIADACNFTCESCTHFSNEGFSGRHTPDTFRAEIGPWASRIVPEHFLILGGEPTLNPDLSEILVVARELWPEPQLMLVTNGWFLHRHPKLPEVLERCRIHLDVSIHHDAPEYLAKLEEIKELARSWGVPIRWRESHRDWLEYYKGSGPTAQPFADGRPQSSWDHCPSRWCFNIRKGKLWKCPMVAYLPDHVQKHGDGGGAWAPYLTYQALEPTCSDAELAKFTARRVEDCCNMCPAEPKHLLKSIPMRSR